MISRPMTPAEIEAAAKADPDAQPWTAEELARGRHTPRAKLKERAERMQAREPWLNVLDPDEAVRRLKPDAEDK